MIRWFVGGMCLLWSPIWGEYWFDCLNSISCWVVNSVDVYRFFCFSFMG